MEIFAHWNETVHHEGTVNLERRDIIEALFKDIGLPANVYKDTDKNNGTYGKYVTREDVSYHGSPIWEYKVYDVPGDLVAYVESLIAMRQAMIDAKLVHNSDFY